MSYNDEFSIILKSIADLTPSGYGKWLANMDEIGDDKSNLRILGISQEDFILIYDNVLLTEDCRAVLKLLSKSEINFIYITDLIELK